MSHGIKSKFFQGNLCLGRNYSGCVNLMAFLHYGNLKISLQYSGLVKILYVCFDHFGCTLV